MNANLGNLGNFQFYEHGPRVVVAESPLDSGNPMMVLKFYNMFRKGTEPIMKRDINLAKGFIETEARMSRLNDESGLGFIIMSQGFLNVARWSNDRETPYLLKNQVYEWKVKGDERILTKGVDLNKDGAFCMFELGVVDYERKAWEKYLKSERRIPDKIEYVNDTFAGEV